jgi:hypothetical protein
MDKVQANYEAALVRWAHRGHLMGLAAYASQIEPGYGRDLKDRLENLDWPVLY